MNIQSDKEPTFWQQNLTALLEDYKSSPAGFTSVMPHAKAKQGRFKWFLLHRKKMVSA